MISKSDSLEKGFDPNKESHYEETEHTVQLQERQTKLDAQTLFKLDILLVPMMCAIYLLAFLDRANIGNARVAGLQDDLGLTDHQYQTAITMTYVPYIVAELPSNLIFQKVGAKLMLPTMCFCWGFVTTVQSLVKNYASLLACRAFLGFFEGGMFPGIVLYLSGFYKPHELQIRVALFFSAAALSGAFSGLLAAVIEKMDGIAGLTGWSWIFLLEGLFTVSFAIFAFWILPNTPQQVKTFSREQADWCEERLRGANSVENHDITLKAVLSTFKDVHVWLTCLTLFCNGVTLFGLSYFTPSIVSTLGFDRTKTQLFTVPPFACAFFITMISAFCADRYKQRGLTAICTSCIALVGFAIFLTQQSTRARYAALCLMITGVYSAAPSLISWIPNNVAAHSRRATAVAMGFVATNIGGIVSTWCYPRKTAPRYLFAARFNISLICISIVLMAVQILLLREKNKRKMSGAKNYLLDDLQELSPAEQRDLLGDHHPDYRYTL